MKPDDQEIERRARQALDEDIDGLSAEIRSRLTQIRHQALEHAERPAGRRLPWLIPAAGVTAAALLAVAIWWPVVPVPEINGSQLAAADLEVLLSTEEPEMLEDLEFVIWLEQQGHAG